MSERIHDAIVVGAGVVGLAAAWQLGRLGLRDVVVVERFAVGHDQGSSHGAARITRTAYGMAGYARLMRQVHAEEWPALSREAGVELVRPCDGLFFGPDQSGVARYAQALAAAGSSGIDLLSTAEARRRFPRFYIGDGEEAIHDHTAGVIAAAETVRSLARLIVARGGTILEGRRVTAIRPTPGAVEVAVDRKSIARRGPTDSESTGLRADIDSESIAAARLVVAAGSWVSELCPLPVVVTPQHIGYFDAAGAAELPVWVRFDADGISSYGLPDGGRIKIARHLVGGAGERTDLPALLRATLDAPDARLVATDRCLYTSTANEEFIVGHWRGDPRIAVGSACSGHGFKFAPLTGRALAELVVLGKTAYWNPGSSSDSTM